MYDSELIQFNHDELASFHFGVPIHQRNLTAGRKTPEKAFRVPSWRYVGEREVRFATLPLTC